MGRAHPGGRGSVANHGHGRCPAYGKTDAVVANVWDWDPAWKVLWYEDGQRRGWVEPYITHHLFVVLASATAHEITVEATDRFGRVYTARLPQSGRPRGPVATKIAGLV